MIYFVGHSFAAKHLRDAAVSRGLGISRTLKDASLIFVSQDTATDNAGNRDLGQIRNLLNNAVYYNEGAVFVLTSQVPPGFTRSLGWTIPLYHQAETLRVKDAAERALNPEQIIVGCSDPSVPLPTAYLDYLIAFRCLVFKVSYEEAEFSKIAINMTLASQVENTNRLAQAAGKIGADWEKIANILKHDRRIGPHSYLTPGDWKESQHLLRDYVTLKEIENG